MRSRATRFGDQPMSPCIPTDRARAGRANKQNSSSSGGDRLRHLLYGVWPVVYVSGLLENSKLASVRSADIGGRASPRAVKAVMLCLVYLNP